MANSSSNSHLTSKTLLLRDDAFYDLVKEHCGDIVLEIVKAQDISSVECLLDVDNLFSFLELESDELIPLRRKAGIMLNNGRFVVKKGIAYKVETFIQDLRTLDRRHTAPSSHSHLNADSDLTVSISLIDKFPFLRTLIVYSHLFVKNKTDFTLFNALMNNIVTNLVVDERGYRYITIVKQFAFCLYILGGRTVYEFVRMNIPAFLPSINVLQLSLAAAGNRLLEGQLRYDGLQRYFTSAQSTFGFCAEDCTAVIEKVNYDTMSNTFIGFSLPLDDNGFPVVESYSTDSFAQLEDWCSRANKVNLLSIHVVQSLSPSLNNTASYLLAAFGTDNRFESRHVLSRWRHIFQSCNGKGIRILGFSTDCDTRYLRVMRLSLGFFAKFVFHNHPDLFRIDVPSKWSWFLMQNRQLFVCLQDPIHLCTKLRNRLLSTATKLLLGDQLINVDILLQLVESSSKLDHGLVKSDICQKDRQNYSSCVKISSDAVISELEKVQNSLGIRIYLQAIKSIRLAYIEKSTNIIDRIFHAWSVVFIFRLWSVWISEMKKEDLDLILSQFSNLTTSSNTRKTETNTRKKKKSNSKKKKNTRKKKTKSPYFITNQAFFSDEINAHSLVFLASLVCEKQLPYEALNIWLLNSQSCESTFRAARSMSSNCSSGVNFSVQQFISKANKLSMLQEIKGDMSSNGLRFPQHHKLSKMATNTPVSSNKSNLSKEQIERSVLQAYEYVTKLFTPLNIKELWRNGQMISMDELSSKVSYRLEKSKVTDIDETDSDSSESDSESDDTVDNSAINYDANGHIIDEETNSDCDIIDNVNGSIFRGLRLVDNVDESIAQTYFKVTINNEKKYMHKQTACWLLQKDKSSLSADRLSRVMGE